MRDLAGRIQENYDLTSFKQAQEAAKFISQSAIAGQIQQALITGGTINPADVPRVPGFTTSYRYIITIEFIDPETGEPIYRSFPIDRSHLITNEEIAEQVARIIDEVYIRGLGSPRMGDVVPSTFQGFTIDHIFAGQ